MSDNFQIAALTPGLLKPSIAISACRAGELGVLDFEFARNSESVNQAIQQLSGAVRKHFGIKLSGDAPELLAQVIPYLPENLATVILTASNPLALEEYVLLLREKNINILLEATCLEQAQAGEVIGVNGIVAKGHEAGGRIADETTFILVQRFRAELRLPIWAYGGIGLHTAAACAAAGVAGIILDSQLALTRESPFADFLKSKITSMDGSETICLGEQLGETYRIYFRPGSPVVKELQGIELRLVSDERPARDVQAEWREAVAQRAGWTSEQNALMLGQDATFAAPLAERFRTVSGVLQAMREAIRSHCHTADRLRPLAEGSSLARSHGTRYPIMQGPMTRVSDVPEFAANVAEGGGLPFLALALMRGPEVKTLLAAARERMGSMPWGVGVLGFVPPELRQEQMDVVREYRPPFALIAGGRPDQAHALEQQGIPSYLHVPSPGLLKMFVQQGARRFVFEGRECGGHVGPRTSFVLWNQMMDVLLQAPELEAKPESFHVVFAAGIHDALSAAMVSVIAAPLAERGVRIGVLLGSAYLFTKEVVSSGAILSTFQEQARECRQTVLLETGPGHSTRCVNTPYATSFTQEKRRLLTSGLGADEIRNSLEDMNLGRLRIASKGVTRNSEFGQDPVAKKLVEIDQNEQVSQGMYMIGQVAALRHTICTVESLHHEISVEGSNQLQGLSDRSWQAPVQRLKETPSDVAIVGMACLLPKAPDLRTYWENILNKVDAVTEVPKERWDSDLYYHADPKAKDKIYSKWGGFLDDTAFDPMQYGMPPATLRSIEPSQLLTLDVVRAALEDAGYADRPFARERTSVILGAGGGAADLGLGYGARSFLPVLEDLPEFQGRTEELLERLDDKLPEWTEDSFAGILTNVAAGRVANRFNLGGSNYTVDAACASSLAAVSLALKELEGQTSDMVIVGGIDTMQNPFTYLCFSKTHALSPRGRCRTFDETADGIAISEGIAMMVFKRVEDAERDGDRIYAVIKGAGSSSDGKDRGLTAPRPEGQASALRRAYAKAGLSPATVGLVEAHGTGTVAGDGAEVQALTQVFSEAQAERQGCAIGSVKSMIGHTKCTAGAAGLVKAALALHHKVLPPTLGVQKPNPRARFPETPFFVNTEARPWLSNMNGQPRRAGVSAFGFGGTNFHIVVEEYTGETYSSRSASRQQWSDELFVWRGDSRQALLQSLDPWQKALSGKAKPALRDLAYTAWKQAEEKQAGKNKPSLQLAIVANSLEDLKQKLQWAQQSLTQAETTRINDPRGIYFAERPLAAEGKLAFLFPGQGSQYPHMLQDLLILFPEMQWVFEQADRILAEKLEKPLSSYVFPPSSFSPEEEKQRKQALTQTNIAQPALGAADLAMFGLLHELGLRPDMMAGHSYGEYVALAAAGVFSTETLLALSEARGRFIVEGTGKEPGVMAAIEAEGGPVAEALKGMEGVSLANSNAPRQSVISGTRAAVERAVEQFTAQGITARMIPVSCAFHSSLVAPAQEPLRQFLSTVDITKPAVTVYSNTTAEPYPQEPEAVAARLVDHLVQPVEFVREIEAMHAAGARLFVEVGPRSVLTSLTDQILGDRPKLAVASNQNGKPGLTQLLHLLAQLAGQGSSLTLDRFYRDRSVRRLDLQALQRESGEKALPSSVWLVNGHRAKPLKEAAPKVARELSKPAPATAQQKPANLLAPRPVMPTPVVPSVAEAVRPSSPAPSAFSAPVSPVIPAITAPVSLDGVPQVMEQFQQMMTRFLETQKTIMLTYLGAESGVPSAWPTAEFPTVAPPVVQPLPSPVPLPVQVAVPLQSPVLAPEPVVQVPVAELPKVATPVAAESVAPKLDTAELTSRLLAIVSDRTGYPPEMLDLNLDLEADLGIDSIKRVEILGTFQQAFAENGVAMEGLMEKLAGVRTLQGILEQVSAQMGSDAAATSQQLAPVPLHVPQSAPVMGAAELTSRLLAIVSDRTGYPPEMLDLHLDLEADLGIDSIKRVEILGTFQQTFAESGIAMEGLMEKLAGVRTLQGIVDQVAGQLGGHTGEAAPQPLPELVAAHVAAPAVNASELTSRLISIVSDRTGYPPEMLDLNLDLEADLGIDSIKRVEILGTFQQAFAESGVVLAEGMMEKLAGVRTLQGILDRVLEQGGAAEEKQSAPPAPVAAVSSVVAPPEAEDSGTAQIQRFTLRSVETPLSGRFQSVSKDRVILITEDTYGVAHALADELHRQGYSVAMVRADYGVRELDKGIYAADLGSPDEVTQLVHLVKERQGTLGGIVHLASLPAGTAFPALSYQAWKEQLRLSTKSLFYLAKAAGKQLRESAATHNACLIAATGMGGTFMTGLPSDSVTLFPDQGGVVGLTKTMALEWPEVRIKAVDLNLQETAPALAGHLLNELNSADGLAEVGYHGHSRISLQVRANSLSREKQPKIALDSSSVILITGGARGITARAAVLLAERYQPTLVLAGRSPLPDTEESPETAGISSPKELKAALMEQMRKRGDSVTPAKVEQAYARLNAEREVRRNLAVLHQFGARVHYYSVDVRDAAVFGSFVEEIYRSFGRLDGVIHGAGVIEDKLIQDKTPDSFDRVFDTKVDSAFVLSQKLHSDTLKFLVFFSSVSGRFGNRGQGDYAAANEVLNKLAVSLDRAWPGRVVAINWGPWDTEGMVSAEVRKQFAERGVELISPSVGLRLLEEELLFGHRGEAEVVIGGAGWQPANQQETAQESCPLLGPGDISHVNGSLEFVRELDLSRDLYLNDHRLDGQPVMPLAMATELMAEAVAHGWPEMQVAAVNELRVLQGIVLEKSTKTVRVVAKPKPGATPDFAHVAVEVFGTGKPARMHYRATVELARRLPHTPSLTPTPLADGGAFSMTIADLYRLWLFHGPMFQGISHVDSVGPSGIKATLMTSSPAKWIAGAPKGHWLIDPLMFDSALQLLVLWARKHWDMTALPSGFQTFRRFAASSGPNILCEMRIRPNTGGQTIHADIFFMDAATGQLLSVLEDMQGACSQALNRLAGWNSQVAVGSGT